MLEKKNKTVGRHSEVNNNYLFKSRHQIATKCDKSDVTNSKRIEFVVKQKQNGSLPTLTQN